MVQLALLPVGALLMFAIEFYHTLAHFMILSGMRMLPRKDLIRIRYYFLVDTVSVMISTLLHGRFIWLTCLQVMQHLFYFFTWEQSYMAKRIVDWSSLDWFRPEIKGGRFHSQIDSFLGTLFDMCVHVCMMYGLASAYLDVTGILLAVIVAQAALYVVIFNPKFAWSNPDTEAAEATEIAETEEIPPPIQNRGFPRIRGKPSSLF
ncbi:hypothetical protein PoB_007376100 [Plakobranchus ocellatus]|uniref:Uncharacterized protein n=1 Tax=Plakobranchus ocellatus TaxID=259542 RepID=A0AAV4DT55_9GAST|nr:hypothetical protein PoB_007376100 [Plakobranchus ocellatus]